jgi:manganese efflux pump family protein
LGLPAVLLVALGLAMDALAVSLGIGATQYANSGRSSFRLWWHSGLFQFLMPLLGYMLGLSISRYITTFSGVLAFILLSFVGVRMIRSGLDTESESHTTDPSRGLTMVMLSIAVSIDALAVGVSLALTGVSILLPAVIIGIVTSTLSFVGLRIGGRLGQRFGKRMEMAGGLLLVGIGLKVLI